MVSVHTHLWKLRQWVSQKQGEEGGGQGPGTGAGETGRRVDNGRSRVGGGSAGVL